LIDVDPNDLRLPPGRIQGADPGKLARQISRFGRDLSNMPAPEVIRDAYGLLMILNGVTRATRIAKLCPGTLIPVEVTRNLPKADFRKLPTIGDRLP
jgi:hypothetical protein